MGISFGTDGIRGIANQELTPMLAYRIGRAAAHVLSRHGHGTIVMGKDTRISSDLLAAAVTAGICATGTDVLDAGVLPTPAVSRLVGLHGAQAGVMISASHNPFAYNGIKLFDRNGRKLSAEREQQISGLLGREHCIPKAKPEEIGIVRHAPQAAEVYAQELVKAVPMDLNGQRILVDCANGAACTTAPLIFDQIGAEVHYLNRSPDGKNINEACGSTHLEALQRMVCEKNAAIGVAFDGDADRCLAVDETGAVLDGDRILAACAANMQKQRRMNGLAVTVLSNLGLNRWAQQHGIALFVTDVGDRQVMEAMRNNRCTLGGEASGHILFSEYAATGDGQLTALMLLRLLEDGACASGLGRFARYAQVMRNVPVPARTDRTELLSPDRMERVRAEEAHLGDGRILVRLSGTEPLLRILAEGLDAELVEKAADRVAQLFVTE